VQPPHDHASSIDARLQRQPRTLPKGLQFRLQFTAVRPSSPGYTRAARPAARAPLNPGELATLKLLIRGFEVGEREVLPPSARLIWARSSTAFSARTTRGGLVRGRRA
jgi:hypothetical protein